MNESSDRPAVRRCLCQVSSVNRAKVNSPRDSNGSLGFALPLPAPELLRAGVEVGANWTGFVAGLGGGTVDTVTQDGRLDTAGPALGLAALGESSGAASSLFATLGRVLGTTVTLVDDDMQNLDTGALMSSGGGRVGLAGFGDLSGDLTAVTVTEDLWAGAGGHSASGSVLPAGSLWSSSWSSSQRVPVSAYFLGAHLGLSDMRLCRSGVPPSPVDGTWASPCRVSPPASSRLLGLGVPLAPFTAGLASVASISIQS